MAGADGSSPNPGSYEKLVGSLHRVLAEKYVPFDFVNGYKNGYMQGLLDKGALAEVCRLEKPEKVQMFLDAALNEWHESSRILEGMGDEIAKRDQAINLFAHSSMCVFKLLNAAKEEVKALQV
jgi:hypothetical protein